MTALEEARAAFESAARELHAAEEQHAKALAACEAAQNVTYETGREVARARGVESKALDAYTRILNQRSDS